MLEYFEEQIRTSIPLTAEGAAEMVANRVKYHSEAGTEFDEVESTEYFNSKIGKHLLFYIKTTTRGFEVYKVWEDEIDTLAGLTFVEMSGTTPKFE